MRKFVEILFHPLKDYDELKKNTFLVLTEINTTPPHCSLLLSNKWYSLNFNECKNEVPAEMFFKLIQSKNEPTIFLELSFNLNEKITSIVFSQYTRVDFQKHITCISPIKEILVAHGVPISTSTLLFEMIELLYEKELIKEAYSLFYSAKSYCLNTYSKEDLLKIKL